MQTESFADVDTLPKGASPLFEHVPFQSSLAWWRSVQLAALPAGARPHFVLCSEAGSAVALLPLMRTADGRLLSMSTPYTVLWQPLAAPGIDPSRLARAGRALGRACRSFPVWRLEAIDPDWPGLAPLLSGFFRARFVALGYDHFGNWQEDVAGRSWSDYLHDRPGVLRETIRRRQAQADRDAKLRFELACTPDQVRVALPAYAEVYRRSWKQPEPFPDFDAALLPAAAQAGAMRLAVLWHGAEPIAAQYWTVWQATATVLKLAHDEAHRARSPGTLLTAWMVRRLLDTEHVETLDFGRGDDPYKQLWATSRRQRIGLVLADPAHPAGLFALARQSAGRLARRLRRSKP
jgi:CelD/BcsL family acetyltransferase involved in cellulose biosynthesis